MVPMRLLFYLSDISLINGANRCFFELINRLMDADYQVDVLSHRSTEACLPLRAPCLDRASVSFAEYDLVFIGNGYLIPQVLPHTSRAVYYCMNYDSFCHGECYETLLTECEPFSKILQLPVPIVTVSESIRQLLWDRHGKRSDVIPPGIDKGLFCPKPGPSEASPKRVLMVGNPLLPLKGMEDGFKALEALAQDMPIQLVIITQEEKAQSRLEQLSFPVEVHYAPPAESIPGIYGSCHVYCCSSLYEGLGLPGIEAFCCGVPVVSTQNQGVMDYGIAEVNLLLAEPNNAESLYCQLKRVLADDLLAQRLKKSAWETVQNRYDWDITVHKLENLMEQLVEATTNIPPVEAEAMRQLVQELEEKGLYTSPEHVQALERLSEGIEQLCVSLSDNQWDVSSLETLLRTACEQIRPFLNNPHSPYYGYLRYRYDLFQLVLTLQTEAVGNEGIITILLDRHVYSGEKQ